MSDFLKHECGVAFVRLRKPIQHYVTKYQNALWGFHKLFLLMEKQHNRGHDGVGIASTKIDAPLGQPYMFRARSAKTDSLNQLIQAQITIYDTLVRKGRIDPKDGESVKAHFDFGGELLMGHLRYGTSGAFSTGSCHPYLRRSNWPTKSLMVLGNFNMTNARELNQLMVDRGQHPVFGTDTQTVLEEIGFHLDEAHTDIYREMRDLGTPGAEIPAVISERLDIEEVVRRSARHWDGGFTIAGQIGNGDSFVLRDPRGIRPCFLYESEDVFALASERVPLMTVFDASEDQIRELPPGHVFIIRRDGSTSLSRYADPVPHTPCSFERIYFSRGNDPVIYQERKRLGAALVPQIITAIEGDLEHAVCSFIPNTAEVAYHGLMDGLRLHRRAEVKDSIMKAAAEGTLSEEAIDGLIMRNWPRGEKILHKDIKMRTFISQESSRLQMASYVYDITYGEVRPGVDSLVALDDSIVRGTTLKQNILKMLTRTRPYRIVVCSTAPQIRYPDCYGIDMAEIGKFIAFQAAIELLRSSNRQSVIDSTYLSCLEEIKKPAALQRNAVIDLYVSFTDEQISSKISEFIYPENDWKGELLVVYQTVENLHAAISPEAGDWYFTGNYPTPGGTDICNRSFIHWYENKAGRVYDV
ncbi:MAG: glutamine amidotransferase class-II [Verrucomicrobiales bacterium]|nr:glutamine amidotransferase class-II [Verrucomicrobiales bacterium]